MNIQVIRENTLNIPRGLYTAWMGNELSDITSNALIAEGAALLTNIAQPSTGQGAGSVSTGANNVFTKAQRGSAPTIPYAATITLDFSSSNSFNIGVLTGNLTLANPTNMPAANVTQSGSIFFQQDATGGRTLTLGTNFRWAGATGVLSTAASARDRLDYVTDASGLIHVSLAKGIS